MQGHFLTDRQGRPIANDFFDVFAAGRLAREGAAASAYDWPLHKAAEVRALSHDFPNYYGWHYPPPFCSSRRRWRCCLISPQRCFGLSRRLRLMRRRA